MNIKELSKILYRLTFRKTGSVTPEPLEEPQLMHWGQGTPNTQPIPKIIWMYWHSETLPITISVALDTIKRNFDGYEIRMLNNQTVEKYAPNALNLSKNNTVQSFTDYLRLFLIKEFGGIWIDASILFTKKIENIFDFSSGSEFYGFWADSFSDNSNFPIMENWFIASPPHSKFITAWFNEFSRCINSANPKSFYTNFILENNLKHKIDFQDYHACYFSCAKVLVESDNYNLSFYKAGDTGLLYSFAYLISNADIADILLINRIPNRVSSVIKLIGAHRKYIEDKINKGSYRTDSLFFSLSKNRKKRSFDRLIKWLR